VYWMMRLLVNPPCSLEEDAVQDLLASKLVSLDAASMTLRGWHLFRSFFLQAVGLARYCSPRHKMPFHSRQDASNCVSMTRRAISARP